MSERVIKLSLEKAKEFYNKGGEFRDLALSAFTEEELQEEILPNTWDEFCSKHGVQNEYYIGSDSIIKRAPLNNFRLTYRDSNLLPNKQAAEAHLALIKLHQLRDCYRQGWVPTSDKVSFGIIRRVGGDLETDIFMYSSRFLLFQSLGIAKEFLDNFRDLIEQAGDLI